MSSRREIFEKILYQYFTVFYPTWNNFSSENIIYMSLHSTKNLNHPWLGTRKVK